VVQLGLRTFLHAHQRHISELDLIRGLVNSDRHLEVLSEVLWWVSQKVLRFADACCARLNKVGHDFGGGIIAPTHYDSRCSDASPYAVSTIAQLRQTRNAGHCSQMEAANVMMYLTCLHNARLTSRRRAE
jgi:hypothetical protein